MNRQSFTASDAKAKFFEISEKAAKGIDVIISKKGEPQTVLISYEKYNEIKQSLKKRHLELLEQIREHREKQKPQSDSVPLIQELRQGRF